MSDQNQWKIERYNLCMHVTALKSLGNFLFIAEGNQISVLNLKTKEIVKSEVVFSSSSIHGIRSDGNSRILFFGSKSLKIYSFVPTSALCLKSCSPEILLHDWIFDVKWVLCSKEQNIVVVITAHNSITVLNIDNNEKLKTVQCAENCILYSANILIAHENAIVVAVGTVFKQILLWSPDSVNDANRNKIPIHCLEGHKGVIFSISFNRYHKLLSSTSDDRSIRLWKVNSVSVDDSSLEFWEKSVIYPSHVLFAHESRVWTSLILENFILSVGEDSCICVWNMEGKLLKRKKCHKGGSIWCLETNNSLSKADNCLAITGGSDGGIYCWEVQSTLSTDLITQISLSSRFVKNDFPRAVSIIYCDNSKKFLATTDKGWLSFYDVDEQIWEDVYHDESFISYCNSSISSNRAYIALGNLNGDLVLLNSNDISDRKDFKKFKIHSGKIFSLHWVDTESKHLLSCGAEGQLILWKVDYQTNEFSIHKLLEFFLPKCKPHWWSTCALYIDATGLVVGDRGGSINFYSFDSICEISKPSVIYKSIHGENGVTDTKEHKSLIYSSGRDGRVLLYCIREKSLQFLYAIKITHDLEWIGKILFCGSDLLLLGFHTKYFIVWSTALESTIMTVECGGGHRSWDFHLSEKGQATFTAIKKKDIIFSFDDLHFTLNKSIIKAGVSGKEFCQVCYLCNSNSSDQESMSIFAASGEDNALRIIGFINGKSKSSKLITLNNLSGHLSSIRSLARTSMLEENTYLLASVGGRAQMMLWKIKNNRNLECEQLASCILSTSERKNRKLSKESQDVQVDPQTRLMDVSVKKNCENLHNGENYIIALACSDSYFRVYDFNASEKLLSLCYNIQLGEHCTLKLSCIQHSVKLSINTVFVTTSTCGHLIFVNHEKQKSVNMMRNNNSGVMYSHYSPFKIHLHQSGINSIDINQISDDVWLICTGGDDNALSAVAVRLHSFSNDCKILAKAKISSAHSSQITGVKFLDQNTIVSVSIDQRINFWKWNCSATSLNITLETSKMAAIPDIANLVCWKNRYIYKRFSSH